VRLVGFIIRIYHDARSPEHQIRILYVTCTEITSWLWTCTFGTCKG